MTVIASEHHFNKINNMDDTLTYGMHLHIAQSSDVVSRFSWVRCRVSLLINQKVLNSSLVCLFKHKSVNKSSFTLCPVAAVNAGDKLLLKMTFLKFSRYSGYILHFVKVLSTD